MGIRNYYQTAGLLDTISHYTDAVHGFIEAAQQKGLKNALKENNAPFENLPKFF
jgi:hypothetical protein